jgi:hypothetical protein
MSEVKVNKITPTANCGTVTLGDSGDTVAIPAGVTLTSGGALTNSGTITNTGTITGVSITGTIDNQVNWQTTVKTSNFTATAGEGYFCNTTSGAFTVTLPSSPSAGDLVGIKDYANTADTNNITIGRNGSNIEGVANDFIISVEGGSITLIYVDATKGWLSTAAAKASDIVPEFITATGGTITTSGNCKIHTFTGPGTFSVANVANSPANNQVSYMVVAGGGGGASTTGNGQGAGGAGGFREDKSPVTPYTASPLEGAGTINVTATSFPITVGSGGAGGAAPGNNSGTSGTNSIFSTITSAGGGQGSNNATGSNGGSGGGGGGNVGPPAPQQGGNGNTPPVSPSQGNNGGAGMNAGIAGGGGGGGALGVGGNSPPGGAPGGNGGVGATTSISGSGTGYSGGGGGGSSYGSSSTGGTGTQGGGAGAGGNPGGSGTAGTANRGGGGGGASTNGTGGTGGSGIVIIRYKFQ